MKPIQLIATAAFLSLSMGAFATQQTSQSQDIVKQVQQKLNSSGHNVGSADGIIGPKTERGLKDFQKDKGISATGDLDAPTLAALDLSSASTGSMSNSSMSNSSSSSSGAMSNSSSMAETPPETDAYGGAGK